jgi:hypothetical protein
MQEPLQSRLLDSLESRFALHLPMVEPKDEHGSVGKVEHGAGAEGPDELAHSDGIFGHRIARLNS